MKDRDQLAIFESYREEILNKFKDSISGENNIENEDLNDTDSGTPDDIDMGDLEDDDTEQKDEAPKRKVVVKSEELSTNVGPKLREILRNIPEVSEDDDILSMIKKSIEKQFYFVKIWWSKQLFSKSYFKQ
jgi:hypothetical protein